MDLGKYDSVPHTPHLCISSRFLKPFTQLFMVPSEISPWSALARSYHRNEIILFSTCKELLFCKLNKGIRRSCTHLFQKIDQPSLLSPLHVPSGLYLFSLPLLLILKIIMPRRYTKEVMKFLVCQKGKVREILGANILFALSVTHLNSNDIRHLTLNCR
jgi:hypothetical protein